MDKGGSQAPTQQTVTQQTLPEYAQPYYEDLLQRTAYQSATPYQPYGAQRLAYFSPMEQGAMSRIGQLGMSGTPDELNQAGIMAFQAGQGWNPNIGVGAHSNYMAGAPPSANYNPQSRDSQYQAGQLDPMGYYLANNRGVEFDPGTLTDSALLEQYMNPYYQGVVDVQKREAMRDADMRHQQLGLGAATQGALGGYRDAILRSETERQLGQRLGDIQQEGSERAFTQAQQAFLADREGRAQLEGFNQSQFQTNELMRQRMAELVQSGFSLNEAARQAEEELAQGQFGMNVQSSQFGAGLQLQAYQAYEQAKQAAARMGLDAKQIEQAGQIAAAQIRLGQQQNQLGAAGMLGDFAGQRQSMEMERLNAMLGVGGMERGLMQQGLDMGYQDFLRQQAYPLEQLSLYSNILQGVPIQPGSASTIYGQQPSWGQQALGTGIAALGMYNAYKGN